MCDNWVQTQTEVFIYFTSGQYTLFRRIDLKTNKNNKTFNNQQLKLIIHPIL